MTAPRANLPDTMKMGPVAPGHNSWAQDQERDRERDSTTNSTKDARPTTRHKYENKPMPPTPSSEKKALPEPILLEPKTYVQPAIPLFPPPSNTPSQKMRAVTDPVQPKPLFSTKNLSVSQLKNKYGYTKGKGEPLSKGTNDGDQTSPITPVASEKAAQVLGFPPVPNVSRSIPWNSTATLSDHDDSQKLGEEIHNRAATPSRPLPSSQGSKKSTPMPTKRYLEENGLLNFKSPEVSSVAKRPADEQKRDTANAFDQAKHLKQDHGFVHPAKVGTHDNVGEAELVAGSSMHRIDSFRGVIEDVPPSSNSNVKGNTNPSNASSQPRIEQGQSASDSVSSNVYSPSNYGGVWENDPGVGHTLPPFTPMAKGHTPNVDTASCYQSPLTKEHPVHAQQAAQRPPYSANQFSRHQPAVPTANSWASNNSFGNPFASAGGQPSALLPPQWPYHQNTNSVPSPPQNQHDYERHGSLTATLKQIEMALHYHIECSFGSLSRQITDKNDKAMDQIIRRLDNMEEALNKDFRSMKNEIKDVRKYVGDLEADIKYSTSQHSTGTEVLKGLDAKLQALEKHIEEYAFKCQHSFPGQGPSDLENQRPNRSEAPSGASHRRTESTQPNVGQEDPHQQYQGIVSHTSTSSRMGGASGRRERSNTITGQQTPGKKSEERSNRKNLLAKIGVARGPAPDIRDHPAFAGSQQVQEQAHEYGDNVQGGPMMPIALPFITPSFSDGRWYHQAYGQKR